MKISVVGSCVSRVSLLDGHQDEHGIHKNEKAPDLELEYYFDKHNIALAMLPPPFTKEEVDTITADQLCDKSRDRSLRQQLMKETVPLLLEGEAEYLVIDFYDFHNYIFAYKDTAFCTQANEFCFTGLFKKYKDDLQAYNLLEQPTWAIYGLVDRFFETIMQKFDSDHIILNRFRANTFFLHTDGRIQLIPDTSKEPFQCNDKYNARLRALEEHVIRRFDPYVIDLSRYFMGDANVWNNLNASHFENEFYRETYDQIISIVTGETKEKYFEQTRLFNPNRRGYEEDLKRKFDVEWGLEILPILLESGDELWANVLELLMIHAPEDKRVREYYDNIVRAH